MVKNRSSFRCDCLPAELAFSILARATYRVDLSEKEEEGGRKGEWKRAKQDLHQPKEESF